MRIKADGKTGTRGENELALTGPAQGVYPVKWDDGSEGFVRSGQYDILEEN
jgi:hypothetical protein